jgi:hypothetical protein
MDAGALLGAIMGGVFGYKAGGPGSYIDLSSELALLFGVAGAVIGVLVVIGAFAGVNVVGRCR